MLRALPATKIAADFDWYDKTTIPGIDREKLGYFALSVFWRASVHIWERRDEEPISIDLGPYEEELRQYLLGQTGFPANVTLHVVVCTDALSQDMFYAPSRGRKKDDTTYTFQARGLNFLMTVGKRIPDSIRHSCTVTGPDRTSGLLRGVAKIRRARPKHACGATENIYCWTFDSPFRTLGGRVSLGFFRTLDDPHLSRGRFE